MVLFFVGASNFSVLGNAPRDKKQRIVSRQKYNQAEKLLNNYNYSQASKLYQELLEKSPRNADLNFKLGTCYLNMVGEKEKSVALLEKSVEYTSSKYNVPVDVYFNLGKAYHTNYKFRKGMKVFKDLLQIISPQNAELREDISRIIKMCENGLDLMQHPVNISIINLGNKINTEFAEHSPGVTADESTMIFTSRRKGTGNKVDDDGQFFEDIYISSYENGEWTSPKGIKKLNTIDHDASISVSADGQELYIYKAGYYNRKESEGGDIYVSQLKGKDWSVPKKLNPTINSTSKETHIAVSADGRSIYFTSDRPGGYGGLDIYMVNKLPNGKWGMARNLGPVINTEYDEDGPFIHPDGRTLYFSSRGHKTMGGLDIFKSFNIDGRWSTPMNIGYPINSTDDDVYYTPTPDGKRAYFSSHRKGSLGRTDIFLIKTPESDQKGLFVLKGKVVTTSGEPVGTARITVSLNGDVVGVYNPNSATGNFLFIIEAGKTYDIEIIAEGFRTLRTRLNIPPEYANTENHSVITLLPLTLRTQDEPDYPHTLELIDMEKSHISDLVSEQADTTSIPDLKEFDRDTIEDLQKDSTISPRESDMDTLYNETDSPLKESTFTPETEKDSILKARESELHPLPATTEEDLKKSNQTRVEIPKDKEAEADTGVVTPSKPVLPVLKPKTKEKEAKAATGVVVPPIPVLPAVTPKPDLPGLKPKTKGKKADEVTDVVVPSKPAQPVVSPKSQEKVVSPEEVPSVTILKDTPISSLSALDTKLSYTLLLGTLKTPSSQQFKNLGDVQVHEGKDGMYHYTIGAFKDYNEALKTKKKLQKKGYPEIKVRLQDQHKQLIDEQKTEGHIYYTIQIMALHLPVDKEFFKNIDDVKIYSGNDGFTRYTHLRFNDFNAALKALDKVIRRGYWDAFIRTVIDDHPVDPKAGYQTESLYTIQVMALRYPLNLNFFNDLGKVNMMMGKDGIYRYTHRTYRSKMEALLDLDDVIRQGYWDAFVRKASWGETSLSEPIIDQSNYYTIQVMALRNAKSLSYFKDLGEQNLKTYSGKDSLTRYTFRKFNSRNQALNSLPHVLKKGYWDAFTREIKWYHKK